jgi:hypothetical protein
MYQTRLRDDRAAIAPLAQSMNCFFAAVFRMDAAICLAAYARSSSVEPM